MKSGSLFLLRNSPNEARTPSSFLLRPSSFPVRGAALLIALTFLVLLSAVVLALFSSARTDRQNAAAFTSGQETMRLAETAVNLVQGQIRDASTQAGKSWASQPGMVRMFDTSGNATAYKLYSSDVMVVSGFGKSQIDAESTAMAAWNASASTASYNAMWCDLNAPAVVKRPDESTPDPNDTTTAPVFPIADPAAIGAVEGFSANATLVVGTTLGNGTTRRLPMPVKWIYVLKDGQMTAPTSLSGSNATFGGPVVPSQSNPIVGRIAFWADDDTCKLNINTASEGSFWDVPMASSNSEKRLAIALPVQGEYQRMPGHPATTSLSPVLGGLLQVQPPVFLDANFTSLVSQSTKPFYEALKTYYSLTPRINFRDANGTESTSQGGLNRTMIAPGATSGISDEISIGIWPAAFGGRNAPGRPVAFDSDRFYATTDELLFNPDRTLNNASLTSADVAQREFFLTANSRAPETTLFNTPRIALWPQQTNAGTDRTTKDRLIAFCSQVGSRGYFFQRQITGSIPAGSAADSPTADAGLAANSQLFGYLRNLGAAAIPGFGGRLTDKWGVVGLDRVLAQVFDTVRAGVNTDYVYGQDKNYRFAAYSLDPRRSLGTLLYNGENRPVDYSGGPRGYVVPALLDASANPPRGGGRFATLAQFSLIFAATAINPATRATTEMQAMLVMQPLYPTPGQLQYAPGFRIEIDGLQNFSIAPDGAGQPLGFPSNAETRSGSYTEGIGQGTSYALGNPQNLFLFSTNPNNRSNSTVKVAGSSDLDTGYPFVSGRINVAGKTGFTFSGGQITVKIKSWRGGDVIQTLVLDIPSVSNTMPIPQHLNVTYSGGAGAGLTSDAKLAGDTKTVGRTPAPKKMNVQIPVTEGDLLDLWQRIQANDATTISFSANLIRPGDVVLSVGLDPAGPARGDYRLLALNNVPASNRDWFSPLPGYGTAGQQFNSTFNGTVSTASTNIASAAQGRFASNLRNLASNTDTSYGPRSTQGGQFGWAVNAAGKLVTKNDLASAFKAAGVTFAANTLTFTPESAPLVPTEAGTISATMDNGKSGDWSGGIGSHPDGAFLFRPDPGQSQLLMGGYFAGDQGANLSNPYFVGSQLAFEPNRVIPSPVFLGGIVTPDISGNLRPWQTLLCTPRPAAGTMADHPGGSTNPPDHLFLDNFWMPVVDPYPISDPISTAGKVNLNMQMVPFTHVERSTALRGVLKPVMLAGVENALSSNAPLSNYKLGQYNLGISENIRYLLNPDRTIEEVNSRFASGDIYRSASEVCTIPFFPEGVSSLSALQTWWSGRLLTSDTLREQPYNAVYSRVTTKSNTYTVHYRVQALRQVPRAGRDWAQWVEGQDQVTGEFRGATTIERFLDPNATIPDYAMASFPPDPIDRFYRWRVLSQKQFAP